LALAVSGSPLRLLTGCEAVAFAIRLEDVDVMGEAIEQRAGEPFRAEYGGPFIDILSSERRVQVNAPRSAARARWIPRE
jgi:hypothetical protein